MKSFDTELKKYADKISLKASERRELRERILSYMEYHPLPKQALDASELAAGIPSQSFTTFHFNMFHARIAGGFLAVILILAPFVAERAVPGDVLYLVKTGFNEPIQKQLADSPYEKIEFETKLMERRIAEARSLASEGKLTEEVKTQIAETVKVHTDAVRVGLDELRSQDADGAAIAQIAFSSSLEVQAAVLDADESVGNDSLIAGILTVVGEARDEVVSNQVDNKPSFIGLMAQVERETTRAYELFGTVKQSASRQEVRDIERRLNDINRLITEAKEKQTKEEGKGVDDLAATLGLVQKLTMFMTDLDVRRTVALETLVPVVLSTEERTELARKELESIGLLAAEVTARLEGIVDAGVKEKVTFGLDRTNQLTNEARAAIERTDISAAEILLTEANAIATDIIALAKNDSIGIATADEPMESTDDVVTITADEGVVVTGTSTAADPFATGLAPEDTEKAKKQDQ